MTGVVSVRFVSGESERRAPRDWLVFASDFGPVWREDLWRTPASPREYADVRHAEIQRFAMVELRSVMRERKIRNYELAELMGVGANMVSDWLTGRRWMTMANLLLLESVVGVPVFTAAVAKPSSVRTQNLAVT